MRTAIMPVTTYRYGSLTFGSLAVCRFDRLPDGWRWSPRARRIPDGAAFFVAAPGRGYHFYPDQDAQMRAIARALGWKSNAAETLELLRMVLD